jgi:hypothetical protein
MGCRQVVNLVPVSLSERDRAILDFERSWWAEGGVKETAIQERFELSASRYYELLGQLMDDPDAMAHDPLLVRRLRRLRDARQRARSNGGAADEQAARR